MSTEIVITSDDINTGIDYIELTTLSTTANDESQLTSTIQTLGDIFSATESANNSSAENGQESHSPVEIFEAFIITEIVMTALELTLSILAAIKFQRWRRNYRNQMLMQLSLVRFFKRIFALIEYYKNSETISRSPQLTVLLISAQIYIDFVIVILVFFFIKHMYDCLVIVLVKIRQNNLIKVLLCGWLIPLPLSAIGTVVIMKDILDRWTVYLIICSIFKWPVMLLGSMLYLSVLYRVLRDEIRRFAMSLTVITFMLCLVINFYLLTKDIIYLWCVETLSTILINYVLGFVLNFLILCLYVILLVLNFKCNTKSCNSKPYENDT